MKKRAPEPETICAFRGCDEHGRIRREETASGYPIRYCEVHEKAACSFFGSHEVFLRPPSVRQERAAA